MFGMIRITSLALTILLISSSSQASDRDSTQKMSWQSLRCLALNIYHEARGEPLQGKIAVAHVVLNRVAARQYPGQICAVVQQGGQRRRYRCQFSWWCDGRSDQPRDVAAWRESLLVALLIRRGATDDPTKGSLWYHADSVSPYWSKIFKPYTKIGRHIFYVKNTSKPNSRRSRG
jgi:N-acetylmuramoyl-L-alanine amidase